MSHYKKHLAIAFLLCLVGFFMAKPLVPLVMNYINPSQVKFVMTSLGEPFSKIGCFYFYSALFIAAFYLLNVWQRKQNNFILHLLLSCAFSAISIFFTMFYYKLQMLQFNQVMKELSKSLPDLSCSASCPNISMVPLAGLIFIVFYFCLRMFFVTRNKGCCNNI